MYNRTIIFLVVAVLFLPVVNALPAEFGTFSSPTLVHVESPAKYSIQYLANFGNGTTYSLTPSDHGAFCYLQVESDFYVFDYNVTTELYETDIIYYAAGNFSNYIECSAPDYDAASYSFMQAVLPAPTLIPFPAIDASGTSVNVTLTPVVAENFRTLTPDDGVSCFISIQNSTNTVLNEEMLFDDANFWYRNEFTLPPNVTYIWNTSCSGSPNFELTWTSGDVATTFESTLNTETPNATTAWDYYTYRAFYNATLPDGSSLPLNPREHDASCWMYLNDSYSAMYFDEASGVFETRAQHRNLGTYSNEIGCTSPISTTEYYYFVEEITIPAVTSAMPSHLANGSTAMLELRYVASSNGELILSDHSPTCNYSVYENETEMLIVEGQMIQEEYELFTQNTPDLAPGYYKWNASCSGDSTVEPAVSDYDVFYIEDPATCGNVNVNSDTTLTDGKTCSNEGGEALYMIATDNIVFDCNGYLIEGIGTNKRRPVIQVENASNVSILNCNFENFGTAIYLLNSTNVSVDNVRVLDSANSVFFSDTSSSRIINSLFTSSGTSYEKGKTAVIFLGESHNNIILNVTTINHTFAIDSFFGQPRSIDNLTVENLQVIDTPFGIGIYGNGTRLKNVTFNNSILPLFLIGSNGTVEDVNIYDSSYWTNMPLAVLILNQSTIALNVQNSTHGGPVFLGSNNIFSLSATNVNGTALVLSDDFDGESIATADNIITFTSLSGNTMDLNISTDKGSIYRNTFVGNINSVFLNVTNSTQRVIATFQTTFSANGSSVNYANLTLFNDAGFVNSTNLLDNFKLSSTSAFLDSSAMPFLSQFATVKLTGASYANTSIYDVLKDGTVCTTCIKLSASPAEFQVFGFSNYSTREILLTPPSEAAPPTTPPATPPTSSPPSAPAPTPPATTPTPSLPTVNATAINQTNASNTTIAQSGNNTGINASQPPVDTSPLTGLFAALPKEFSNPAYQAVAAIVLLGALGLAYSMYTSSQATKPGKPKT